MYLIVTSIQIRVLVQWQSLCRFGNADAALAEMRAHDHLSSGLKLSFENIELHIRGIGGIHIRFLYLNWILKGQLSEALEIFRRKEKLNHNSIRPSVYTSSLIKRIRIFIALMIKMNKPHIKMLDLGEGMDRRGSKEFSLFWSKPFGFLISPAHILCLPSVYFCHCSS